MQPEISALAQDLEKHKEYCDVRFKAGDEKFTQMIACQNQTNARLDQLIVNTAGLVGLHTETQSVGKFAQRIRGWIVTMATYSAIAGGCYWVYENLPAIFSAIEERRTETTRVDQ